VYLERFFGGNPAFVLARLAVISLIVGVVLAALGFSPYDLLQTVRELIQRIYDMGFAAVEKGFRYFLLGAVIVFPVWFLLRLFKVFGSSRDEASDDVVPPEREQRVAAATKQSQSPTP
jgi:hypothetical protein